PPSAGGGAKTSKVRAKSNPPCASASGGASGSPHSWTARRMPCETTGRRRSGARAPGKLTASDTAPRLTDGSTAGQPGAEPPQGEARCAGQPARAAGVHVAHPEGRVADGVPALVPGLVGDQVDPLDVGPLAAA